MAFLDNTGLEHLIGKIATKLAGKSDTGHSHNDLYYTESEINTKLSRLFAIHPQIMSW